MIRLRTVLPALTLLLYMMIAVCPAQAAIIYVDSAAVGANDGSSWTDAYSNLVPALAASVAGDSIWVANGTYYPGPSGSNSSNFALKQNVGVFGGFTGVGGLEETLFSQRDFNLNITRLSGDLDTSGTHTSQDAYHVVSGIGQDTTALIDGFIVEFGNAIGAGADNRGGGFSLFNGGATIQNCILQHNHTSSFGGAIYANVASKVINSTLQFNTSDSRGAACFVAGNAFHKYLNCVFRKNIALNFGGAFFIAAPLGRILNCTFEGNEGSLGPVVFNANAATRFENCIMWDNPGADISGTNPVVRYCIVEGGFAAGVNIIDADPLFADTLLRIKACSPAVDAGDSLLTIADDWDGNLRPFDGDNDAIARWDIGAFESQIVGVVPGNNPIVGQNPACALGNDVPYTLTTNNAPTNSYAWNLTGGGTIDAGGDSSTVLIDWGSTVGTYDLEVTETVVLTGCSASDTISISLDTVPVVLISPTGSATICDEDSFQVMASGAGSSFQWLLNGQPVSGATGPSFFAKDSGAVNVLLTDASGCSDTASPNLILNVNPLPVITFTTSNSPALCIGDSVTITAPAGVSQQWYLNGQSIFGETQNSITVSSAGLYNMIQVDGNTCQDSADTGLTVVVNPLPVVTVSPAALDTICAGDSLAMTASAAGATSFQWTLDGVPLSGATGNPYFGMQSGLYNVLLTDSNTCVDSAAAGHGILVGDFENPVAVCRDTSIFLDATGNFTIDGSFVDDGSTDNCVVDSFGLGQSLFTCADTGTNAILVTVFDGVGNTATCNVTVTVSDTSRPGAICANATLYLDAVGALTVQPADVDGGSSDNCGIANAAIDFPNYTCADTGFHVIALTLTDGSGNANTCNAQIEVVDSTAPQALCQDTVVFLDPTGNATIVAANIENGSSDNCGIDSFFVDRTAFTCADVPSVTVTLTTRDVSGNVATCTGQVRVRDTVPPVVGCLDTVIYIDASGQANLAPVDVDSGSTDNCAIVASFLSQSLFTCVDTGLNMVTVSFVDADTNISSCTSNITILDTVPPVAVCTDTTFYIDSLGVAVVDPLVFGVNSFDNCNFFDTAYVNVGPFTCADTGQYTVNLVVGDVSGRLDSCSGNVTIADSTGPFTFCRDTSIILDPSGLATITATALDSGTFDNCSLVGISIDRDSFYCADAGMNVVTLTSVDNFGNTSTCLSMVEVIDSVAPVPVCQNLTVYLDSMGMASIQAADIDNGSSDNCAVDSMGINLGQFACVDTGANVVTLEVLDQYGNSASCNATVTVLDTILPTAVCNDTTVYLDSLGAHPLDFALIGSASFDNCLIFNTSIGGNNFTCADTGMNVISLTVEDPSGNQDVCTSTVTVLDTLPPVPVCPDTTLYLDSLGNLMVTPAMVSGNSTDNCSIDSSSVSVSSFTCVQIGTNPLAVIFIDPSGNQSQCSLNLTVLDSMAPTAVCEDTTLILNGAGMATAILGQVNDGSFDGCGIDTFFLSQTDFTCADIGITSTTLIVGDNNGNVDSCVAQVTVLDTLLPNPQCNNLTAYVDSLGNVNVSPADLDNGSSDVCGIDTLMMSPPSFDCSNFGTNITYLVVVDNGGNVDSCSATVTVLDSLPPVPVCDSVTVQIDSAGFAPLTPVLVGGSSSDNCAIESMWLDIDTLFCGDFGFNNILLSLTDSSANGSSCTAVVELVDSTGASISAVDLGPDTLACNGDTVSLSPGQGFASYFWSTGETTPSIGTDSSGIFWVDVINGFGCLGTDTVIVNAFVVSDPELDTESGEFVVCDDDSLRLEAKPGFDSYLWSNGDTNSFTYVSTAGNYTLVVMDATGCTRAESLQISYVPVPGPTPVISPPSPYILCEGTTVDLDAGSGYFVYFWTTGATTQFINVAVPGTYGVEVWNGFGCHAVAAPIEVISASNPLPQVIQMGDTLVTTASNVQAFQWNLNGAPIFGASDSIYVVQQDGNYSVTVVYQNGCDRTSLDLPVLVGLWTAADELTGISMYPNPARAEVFLRSEHALRKGVALQITDLSGQVVLEREFSQMLEDVKIDLSGLAQGLYLVELRTEGKRSVKKLAVE